VLYYPVMARVFDIDLTAGTEVGEYLIREKIGSGSFGDVYSAVHPMIGKLAAVKVLKLQFSANPEMVSRFLEEARAVNTIRHPHIIDIFSFGELDDGRQYFIMELLNGQTLEELIAAEGALSLDEARPILESVARALDAAHKAGIAHRDLKPDNVFVADHGDGMKTTKLLDFGVAKLLGEQTAQHKTATGMPVGTPLYMSPEQCRGRDVDQRADLYAFGVVTFHMLTGKVPFTGEATIQVLTAHIATPPPSMHAFNPAVPAALDGPVHQLMAKQATERPASAMVALQALLDAAAAPEAPAAAQTEGAPDTVAFEETVRLPDDDDEVAAAQRAVEQREAEVGGNTQPADPGALRAAQAASADASGAQAAASAPAGTLDAVQKRSPPEKSFGAWKVVAIAALAVGVGGVIFALAGRSDDGAPDAPVAPAATPAPSSAPVTGAAAESAAEPAAEPPAASASASVSPSASAAEVAVGAPPASATATAAAPTQHLAPKTPPVRPPPSSTPTAPPAKTTEPKTKPGLDGLLDDRG